MPCQVYTDAEISQQKSETIAKLQEEVNESTKNYCTLFRSIYSKFGDKGLNEKKRS